MFITNTTKRTKKIYCKIYLFETEKTKNISREEFFSSFFRIKKLYFIKKLYLYGIIYLTKIIHAGS